MYLYNTEDLTLVPSRMYKITASSKEPPLAHQIRNLSSSLSHTQLSMEKQKQPGCGRPPSNYKVSLMCSYGGKIQPKPHGFQLTYVGGYSKILTVDRNIKFCDIFSKLVSLCDCDAGFCIKYQLPGEGLDALVSVVDDDDVEHMMFEYDRLYRTSTKPARLRLFLFSLNLPVNTGSGAPLNPDFLFGLDKEYQVKTTPKIPGAVVSPGESGSNPGDGEGGQTEIVGDVGQGLHGSHVMSNSSDAQQVHRVPVPAGGYQTGAGHYGKQETRASAANREQTVYNFVPIIPSGREKTLTRRNV